MGDNIDPEEPIDNLEEVNCQELEDDGDDGNTNCGADNIPSLNLDAMVSDSCPESTNNGPRGDDIDWLEDKIADDAVKRNAILVPKDKRGDFGTRDYIRNLETATFPLDPKMGVASHFISSRDGETDSGNQTKHQFIQEMFCSNFDKLEQALLCFKNYDMIAIYMVPNVKNKYASKPSEMFGREKKNMILNWDSMNWKDICRWQKCINKWASVKDRTSSRWAQSFLYKSSTLELRERVDTQYKSLPAVYKGGVTYLYLQLKIMFHMSRDTIQALKKYLKLFQEKGLRRIRGENVVIAQKELLAVCTRLDKVNALPSETMIDVLEGLTNFSVPDFTKLFDFFHQLARAASLDDDHEDDDTLKEIKKILTKAVDEYHALCTAGKWHINHTRINIVECWN